MRSFRNHGRVRAWPLSLRISQRRSTAAGGQECGGGRWRASWRPRDRGMDGPFQSRPPGARRPVAVKWGHSGLPWGLCRDEGPPLARPAQRLLQRPLQRLAAPRSAFAACAVPGLAAGPIGGAQLLSRPPPAETPRHVRPDTTRATSGINRCPPFPPEPAPPPTRRRPDAIFPPPSLESRRTLLCRLPWSRGAHISRHLPWSRGESLPPYSGATVNSGGHCVTTWPFCPSVAGVPSPGFSIQCAISIFHTARQRRWAARALATSPDSACLCRRNKPSPGLPPTSRRPSTPRPPSTLSASRTAPSALRLPSAHGAVAAHPPASARGLRPQDRPAVFCPLQGAPPSASQPVPSRRPANHPLQGKAPLLPSLPASPTLRQDTERRPRTRMTASSRTASGPSSSSCGPSPRR